ncbi:MAG: small multi-drug export protein [Clostridia bacterium]|nr:small multi-drug export protein [Clostridia bacterium]
MTDFIKNLIGNDLISTVIMSIIPLIELKGGIVFARGVGFSFFEALGLGYLGSTLVFFPVFFLLKPILNLLKRIRGISKFSYKIENFFNGKAEKVLKTRGESTKDASSKSTFYKCVGVFLFVAIPLPMTGVWTGTAVAVFLGLKFKEAVLPVAIGNAVAGLLISALAELCLSVWTIKALDYLLWGLFALAVIVLVITILTMTLSKPKEKTQNSDTEDKGNE